MNLLVALTLITTVAAGPTLDHDMVFDDLATRWDEAVPLGNGAVGALIWQEGDTLRFSLDRADLWDSRPVENYQKPEFNFNWMLEQVDKGDIKPVQDLIDRPYSIEPAPTKIPAGRLEFDQSSFGDVVRVHLDLSSAICTVEWSSGVCLETFVHATKPLGWFRFTGLKENITPTIVPPPFGEKEEAVENVNSLNTHKLSALGYPAPVTRVEGNVATYHQRGWGDFEFDIHCRWDTIKDGLMGVWAVTSNSPLGTQDDISKVMSEAWLRAFGKDQAVHKTWWANYWKQSSIDLPDPVLEAHWYHMTYLFGSATRLGAPPITLQAVWTADERRIPPWKGDYHHDLNTQLSYWPAYSGNHLSEACAFVDWLWDIKPTNEAFTKQFYGHGGLNVPGTTTFTGDPMGGWNQYSFSPTTSAWLAHHFYMHWRYSADEEFLKTRAYPYLKAVAEFLDAHSVKRPDGKRRLPLSSSPEINDNRITAWFKETTNYDLALVRWLYGATAKMAYSLKLNQEGDKWRTILSEWPELSRDAEDKRLLVAPGIPLKESHRHFSHLMAIHPLGLIDISNGGDDPQTIQSALEELDRLGPDYWCGYSYAWLGSLAARARDGERASKALRIFAECFISKNKFHLNGDQSKSGKSKMQYRPFTLEGNFASSAGIQEMLLQSHTGVIQLFPAIPEDWNEVSFENLRAEGGFLVSASFKYGYIFCIVKCEKGGRLEIELPDYGRGEWETHAFNGASWRPTKGERYIEMTRPGDFFTFEYKLKKETEVEK